MFWGYPDGVQKRINLNAGIRVEFETDAEEIVIRAAYGQIESYPWFSLTGTAGIDIYEGAEDMNWLSTVCPMNAKEKSVEKKISLSAKDSSHITLYLPSYAQIADLEIGFPEGSVIKSPENVDNEKPIIF